MKGKLTVKCNVSKQHITTLLLIIPFFCPSAFLQNNLIDSLMKLCQIGIGLYAVVKILFVPKVKNYVVMISLIHLIIIISAFLHGYFDFGWIKDLLFLWAIYYMTSNEKSRCVFFDVFLAWNILNIIINLITMLLFPDGMYVNGAYSENWFLGYKNVLIRKTLPVMAIYMIRHAVSGKRTDWKDFCLFLICAGTIVLSDSINSLLGLLVFALVVAVGKIRNTPVKQLTILKAFVVYVIIDACILSIFNLDNTSVLDFFTDLGKSSSIRGRIAIWSITFQAIKESPFFGYGYVDPSIYELSFSISHPHNFLLNYLMMGGISCVFIMSLVFYQLDKVAHRVQSLVVKKVYLITVALYSACFVMGILESLTGMTMLFPVLIIVYNIVCDENDRIPAAKRKA